MSSIKRILLATFQLSASISCKFVVKNNFIVFCLGSDGGSPTPKAGAAVLNGADGSDEEDDHDEDHEDAAQCYDKTKSFFDSISL